ncbi:MAG: O-methyltransferase, partial [Candidatus Hydrogenedentes bacterium]|nr:O-methyltransferase [Candidatus Hydrogenedentota bacterium]
MAEGMAADGKLITCDVDPEATAIAQTHWNQSPHGSKIELRLGPALETIEGLTGPIDMVFIDADKENYIHYWEAVLPKVRQGGLIVADNVLWSGRVLKPEKRSDHAVDAFNKHVVADPRVEAVMLTVRDGVTLAWKR